MDSTFDVRGRTIDDLGFFYDASKVAGQTFKLFIMGLSWAEKKR